MHLQSEKGLLKAGAYNQHVPFGVVESFHRGRAGKVELLQNLGSATLARRD
jgi:hypothetical protein